MSDTIPVNHVELRGKKWILSMSSLTLQCAYCIYVQRLSPVRDNTGLVTSLRIEWEDESHKDNCPQKNNKEGNTDNGTTTD